MSVGAGSLARNQSQNPLYKQSNTIAHNVARKKQSFRPSCSIRLPFKTRGLSSPSSSKLGTENFPYFPFADLAKQVPSLAQQQNPSPTILKAAAALAAAFILFPSAPAHASELINSFQAGAVIPGLVGDDPLREGFISAFLLIFFSEIGDKTFFIAVLLALQQPKSYVFTGTFGALAIMTVISVGLGRFLHELDELVPNLGVPLDDLLAVALLIWFGVQTLLSASAANETADEEREEAKEVVDELDNSGAALAMIATTFTLVFAAEWGDKSFLATIALAAASNPAGVVFGAIAGHGVATVIAVLGGSFLGKYLDEKAVQYVGGSLFLVFAAATIYDIATGAH